MKRGQKAGLYILVILLAAAAIFAVVKRAEIQRLLAVNSLFDEKNIVRNFSAMDQLFFHAPIPRGDGPVSPLPENPQAMPDLSAWVAERSLTGLVVLKNGELAYEAYYQGTGEHDKRISWSVAKSYLSALFGILVDEGVFPDLHAPVTDFAPELKGSAYDGASIRDVLQMSSGVRFDEDYLDSKSDINRMGRVLALGGSMDTFATKLKHRDATPGTVWQYVSIDTHVIGMVIRGATGRNVIDLLSEKLIQPLGVEAEPYYLTDGYGTAFVLGGLNMPTRDYARMGQMFLQNGYYNGRQIVSEAWVKESTSASAHTAPGEIKYGYQWWIPADAEDGEFLARGIYGQYVYVNQPEGVVVAMNSADRQFREDGSFEQNLAMFRTITSALARDDAAAADEAVPTDDAVPDNADSPMGAPLDDVEQPVAP